MIDEHTIKTIEAEAANWCLDGKVRGTRRNHAISVRWDKDDSTRLEGVLVVLEERTDHASRTTSALFLPSDPVIVARTIRARFADPFAEEK